MRTKILNGFEVCLGLEKKPKIGDVVFSWSPFTQKFYREFVWSEVDNKRQQHAFSSGAIFDNATDAIRFTRAFLGLDPNKEHPKFHWSKVSKQP